jgi:carboxyl-terminal processing protease
VATISKLRPAQKLVEFADKKGIKRRNLMIRKSFDLMERYQFVNIIDQVMGTEASVQFENQFDSAALKALELIKNGLAFPPLPETNDSTEETSASAVAQTSL